VRLIGDHSLLIFKLDINCKLFIVFESSDGPGAQTLSLLGDLDFSSNTIEIFFVSLNEIEISVTLNKEFTFISNIGGNDSGSCAMNNSLLFLILILVEGNIGPRACTLIFGQNAVIAFTFDLD
jgi:hypothetical protein